MLLRDANPETLLSGFPGDVTRNTTYSKEYAPSEESQVPILQHGARNNGLKNYSDESGSEMFYRDDVKTDNAGRAF